MRLRLPATLNHAGKPGVFKTSDIERYAQKCPVEQKFFQKKKQTRFIGPNRKPPGEKTHERFFELNQFKLNYLPALSLPSMKAIILLRTATKSSSSKKPIKYSTASLRVEMLFSIVKTHPSKIVIN